MNYRPDFNSRIAGVSIARRERHRPAAHKRHAARALDGRGYHVIEIVRINRTTKITYCYADIRMDQSFVLKPSSKITTGLGEGKKRTAIERQSVRCILVTMDVLCLECTAGVQVYRSSAAGAD